MGGYSAPRPTVERPAGIFGWKRNRSNAIYSRRLATGRSGSPIGEKMRFLAAALFMTVTILPTSLVAQAGRSGRPNIIYIMTDDHAAHAISAYGSRVNKTPHID